MENMQHTEDGTAEENTLSQQYYDLAVINIKPKIEEYLNVYVPRNVLKQRIKELRDDYRKLNEIQYKISQIPRNKILKYTKKGDTEPINYTVQAIDTQAKDWLNRLSTTITFMVIKQSEYDVKSSFTRDIVICIISILISVLSGASISWYFSNKDIKLPFSQIICPFYPADPALNIKPDSTNINTDSEVYNKNQY
jgi:hypothetical protein